jgi:allophanate hydrolase subunit 1
MKIRKQWSCNYQVVELEEEVTDLEMANTIGNLMEDIAKQQLVKMVETVNSISGETLKGKTAVVTNAESGLTPAQSKNIKNNIKRAIPIAKTLGIELYNENGVDNLSKKDASAIISELFKGSKSVGF